MHRTALALLLVVLAAPSRGEDEARLRRVYVGEGGSYRHADPAADDYLMGGLSRRPPEAPRPAAEEGRAGASRPSPRPAASPAPSARASARPARPAPRTADAPAPSAVPVRTSSRTALAAAAEPRPAPAARAPAPAAAPVLAADADREGAADDYERRVLGVAPAPARPSLEEGPARLADDAGEAAPGAGRLFVSLELDPAEAGALRDAVSGLGAVGFAPDPRFDALAAAGGSVRVSGWLPASRLGDVVSRPGVRRVRVETRARPARPSATRSDFAIALRLGAAGREGVEAGARALESAAGFRLSRVTGVTTGSDGSSLAILEGSLPLGRLSEAMALPAVASVSPLPAAPAPAAPAAPAGSAPSRGPLGFARYVLRRGGWLVVVTLLMALPALRSAAARLAGVFSPYRDSGF